MAAAATEDTWWQAGSARWKPCCLLAPLEWRVPHMASCPAQPAEPNTKQGGRMNLTHERNTPYLHLQWTPGKPEHTQSALGLETAHSYPALRHLPVASASLSLNHNPHLLDRTSCILALQSMRLQYFLFSCLLCLKGMQTAETVWNYSMQNAFGRWALASLSLNACL